MSQDPPQPQSDDNHRTSVSSSPKPRKKKKKHKPSTTTSSSSNDLIEPLLEHKTSQHHEDSKQHEIHALERITTILQDEHHPPIIPSTPPYLEQYEKSASYHEKYDKSIPHTIDKTVGRQASIVSRSSIMSNGIKPLHDGLTLTILHDNPNVSSNVTELFTTSYGCVSLLLFMMSIIIYEILQYRCIIPYAPFTVYTCVEFLWLFWGFIMMILFLMYPNTFRIKIQASPALSLITLVYLLTFACIPILGWMLFTGVLAPHSPTTIAHLHNRARTSHIPTCIDLDHHVAHMIALIMNIIHSVCLVLICGWCCAPFNNNREGTYLVYKSFPPISDYAPHPPTLLPPPTPMPRQSTEVTSTPSISTLAKAPSILISISDHEETDQDTPLLTRDGSPHHPPSPQPQPQPIHHPDPPPLIV